MAHSPTSMAPPTSPKEPRRSNRRSVHSSASTSKSSGSRSPDASAVALPGKEVDNISSTRSVTSSTSNTNTIRAKRAKDDNDDAPPNNHRRTNSITSVQTIAPSGSSKRANNKRRGKDVASVEPFIESSPQPVDPPPQEQALEGAAEEDEDAGITRCVCEADDDGDAGEFMIQCETCKVWQHGPCMGFATEDQIPQGDYYCEQCKPEDHVELLRRLQKRTRQSSEKSHHPSRASRSHSPTHMLKQAQAKRRNTMNSRDAAYEESIRAILDESAAEAAAGGIDTSGELTGGGFSADITLDETTESGAASRRKRKRTDDDAAPTKRKRSASDASELPILAVLAEGRNDPGGEVMNGAITAPSPVQVTASTKGASGRAKRGGGRKNASADAAGGDGDDAKRHPNQYTYRGRSAGGNQQRRAPASQTGQSSTLGTTHDHGTRRGGNRDNSGAASGSGAGLSGNRNAHHYQAYYNATQLPLFTSWGLPDYLAHLQSILPSEVPPPLVIRGAVSFFRDSEATSSGEGSSVNAATPAEVDKSLASNAMANATGMLSERGVKVKWPAKRMSVADMNKRVRALLEWVGREQACFSDRERRKEALERELKATLPQTVVAQGSSEETAQTKLVVDTNVPNDVRDGSSEKTPNAPTPMVLDSDTVTDSPASDETKGSLPQDRASDQTAVATAAIAAPNTTSLLAQLSRQSTAKMMEELMEELISFQERFGPGAKSTRERGGRTVTVS